MKWWWLLLKDYVLKINNKYGLKQEVYIWWEARIIYSIKINVSSTIEYQLWSKKNNDYEWYEEWQIEEERKIWFNPEGNNGETKEKS